MIVESDLSKYNHAFPVDIDIPTQEIVLIVDQTYGDVYVTMGGDQ